MTLLKIGALLVVASSEVASAQTSRRTDSAPRVAGTAVLLGAARLPAIGNPIAGATFWVNPDSKARNQANEWRRTRPRDAAQLEKIARNSQAKWYGGGARDIEMSIDT